MELDSASTPMRPLSLGGASPPVGAEQVVESLRLWELQAEDGRPRVFLNMASTVDGRTTVGGRSGPIGNRADRELFQALRAAVDAVLVGAGTVRAEGYRRLVRDERLRRLRGERGLAEEPLACVVSASLALSPEIPLLSDPAARVLILTPSRAGELPWRAGALPASADAPSPSAAHGSDGTPAGRGAHLEYVRAERGGRLDLPAALAEVSAGWGVRTILCEGGPHLNGELFAAGLVDELFLSLAPKLAGGAAQARILEGPELDPPVELELAQALESESLLLLRYRVSR